MMLVKCGETVKETYNANSFLPPPPPPPPPPRTVYMFGCIVELKYNVQCTQANDPIG